MPATAASAPTSSSPIPGSYSDLVFGLVHLLGMSYRPQLADLPDQQLWRINPDAGYGPLDTAARGRST
jgi:TnpA family transposase